MALSKLHNLTLEFNTATMVKLLKWSCVAAIWMHIHSNEANWWGTPSTGFHFFIVQLRKISSSEIKSICNKNKAYR